MKETVSGCFFLNTVYFALTWNNLLKQFNVTVAVSVRLIVYLRKEKCDGFYQHTITLARKHGQLAMLTAS